MAVYKVIQDIEAEDKLIGFLTLKGFIYALIAGTLAFINVRLLLAGGPASVRLAVVFLLFFPMALFGLLAAPIGKDQPTEVWLLSHVKFFLKKHKRIWNQSGASQLVTITVPKKIEKQLTKGFSQTEVKSRLSALATTLDSRGWAVKNVNVDINGQTGYFQSGAGDSDRLIGASSISQPSPVLDIHPSDDIMDEQSNATAQNFNNLMQAADVKRKQGIVDRINAARENGGVMQSGDVDYRFLDEQSAITPGTGGSTFVGTAITTPGTVDSQQSIVNSTKTSDSRQATVVSNKVADLGDPALRNKHPHFETKPSLAEQQRQATDQQRELDRQRSLTAQKVDDTAKQAAKTQLASMTAASQADKIELAQSGNDLSVASIAQLANRKQAMIEQISPNEVVINLH